MSEIVSTAWLQYGALGLLSLVLTGVGWLVVRRFAAADSRVAMTDERIKARDEWIHQLVQSHVEERKAVQIELTQLIRSAVVAQTEMTAGLAMVVATLNSHEDTASERHKEVVQAVRTRAH